MVTHTLVMIYQKIQEILGPRDTSGEQYCRNRVVTYKESRSLAHTTGCVNMMRAALDIKLSGGWVNVL